MRFNLSSQELIVDNFGDRDLSQQDNTVSNFRVVDIRHRS